MLFNRNCLVLAAHDYLLDLSYSSMIAPNDGRVRDTADQREAVYAKGRRPEAANTLLCVVPLPVADNHSEFGLSLSVRGSLVMDALDPAPARLLGASGYFRICEAVQGVAWPSSYLCHSFCNYAPAVAQGNV